MTAYNVPKIPPFGRVNPLAWLVQVEATFCISRIVIYRTKDDFIIAVINHEVVSHITDLAAQEP